MYNDRYAQPQKKSGSGLVRGVVLLSVLGLGIYFFLSPSGPNEPREVLIPRGSSMSSVANVLAEQGIIRYPGLFKTMLRFTGGASRLRAGEFRFQSNSRLSRALYTLYYSEPIYHSVTIPEGWTARQIAQALARVKLVDEARFVQLALSPDGARRFKLNVPNLEGFLYPDTYKFSRVDGEERILERMVNSMLTKFDAPLQARAAQMGMTREQVVTLASVVEKETGVPQEREMIASVFHNRLKKKMRLQSDPTTIYGIPNFNGNLTRKDLLTPTAYNTYTIPALPPGPIASPGISAIKAVLYPASTDYLYFVSNNRGSHIFSETYAQHNAHVNNYQKPVARRGNADTSTPVTKPAAPAKAKPKKRR